MAIIYHYCSPEAFVSILKNKKIWLSASNNMNDYSEGTWLLKILEDVLAVDVNPMNVDGRKKILQVFNANRDNEYISCFSKEPDLLSQWRAYAQNGEGVAIGFDEEILSLDFEFSSSIIRVQEIKYLDRNKSINLILEKLEKNNIHLGTEKENVSQDMLVTLGMELSLLASSVKNHAFEEESEKRIIHTPRIYYIDNDIKIEKAINSMQHRVSNGFLTSYFELQFKPEAIVDVFLGPRNKFSQHDIDSFFSMNQLGRTKTYRSAATYR
ncbi:DUF2971 domain-containing protein [Pectobacterium versatile]|uniref:DUF2971 domain-containing protein n=1 Tax=Pectobacterium versatile TaxID=2488639 RepID=UPI001BB2D442|nr:DUF2971 domain-containing protein [Pectobacterium versatile]